MITSFERVFQTATPRKGLCDMEEVSSVKEGFEREELNYKDHGALFCSLSLFTILCIVQLSGSSGSLSRRPFVPGTI